MKYNILYVDDEPENLRAFKSVFRRDYNIYVTESPLDGLDYIHKNKVHLIITDQRMPEMTGVEFLEKVHKFMPEIPPTRMILSAYSKSEVLDEALDKKWFSVFVSKPWEPDNLKSLISNAIEKI